MTLQLKKSAGSAAAAPVAAAPVAAAPAAPAPAAAPVADGTKGNSSNAWYYP